jgi:hypothetical protein
MVAIVLPDVQKQQPACRFCLCLKPDIHAGGANLRLDHDQSQHLSEFRYDHARDAHASAITVQPSARFDTRSFPMSDCLDTADAVRFHDTEGHSPVPVAVHAPFFTAKGALAAPFGMLACGEPG